MKDFGKISWNGLFDLVSVMAREEDLKKIKEMPVQDSDVWVLAMLRLNFFYPENQIDFNVFVKNLRNSYLLMEIFSKIPFEKDNKCHIEIINKILGFIDASKVALAKNCPEFRCLAIPFAKLELLIKLSNDGNKLVAKKAKEELQKRKGDEKSQEK